MSTVKALKLDELRNAVSGSAAAFRLTLALEAASPKVFPPTYEGGKYATEERELRQDFDMVQQSLAHVLRSLWEVLERKLDQLRQVV